jgi:hypothetical protein
MLRKIALALIAVTALTLATTAGAQDAQRGKIGAGVAFANDFDGSFGTVLLVPLNLAPNLKIEPMIGLLTVNGGGHLIWIGTGAFFVMRAGGNVDILAGGRLSLDFVDDGVDTGTDFKIAAALGAEYFLAPKFSLGAEADLGFYNNSDVSPLNAGADGFFTQGWVMARFYF